jgi:hypothetical protein
MTEGKPSTENFDSAVRENALAGYQVAISLWTSHGELGWARFNGMLVANSIIIAVIGLTFTSQQQLTAFMVLLSILGLLLCGVWFFLGRREAQYSDYFVLSARELEEKYLTPLKTISRGGPFAEGQTVTIEARWIIVILAILYVATLLQVLL